MSNYVTSQIKRDHLMNLLAEGRREDGRQLDEVRKITVETGVIESAEGSAKVSLGNTTVMAGIKIIPGAPYMDAPGDGVITTGAELIPLAHASFEPGPPSEDAIELARVVDRGIRESGMIDVKKLCIKEGEEIWMVFIDIYALDYDGNLFDACNLAAVCALRSAKVPWKQYGKGEEDLPMPVTCLPISVTECKIGNDLIVDPNFDEEAIAAARLTVTTDDDGNFRAMQKGGRGSITRSDLSLCLDRAVEIGKQIRKIIG
ncbi:MAG: exosome complex protein Rrp42 [Candidatus Methanomethylophilus sp.]|jgi:exosome complex component RRP42|nr:exosome complex RNA-binding protein Rrp42 [methanogenic archaeon ISO4-H5]MBO5519680.1 exosome complex protein Rrp42 [Methanomethylophilus sp.]MBO5600367.1 exosome complex protein Rrp42 [Methanomethylophilus sp.]MBQ1462809.1 exosome complex protein Rrp42 [Methanomethylophilus sp.]MBQ5448335.1 exosome complex protein Rrp42 [Methanomethylophilus sp.]